MTKLILIVLVTSLATVQVPSCEAFIFDFNFIKDALAVRKFVESGIDIIKWLSPAEEMEDNTSKLLDQMSKNMEEMKNALKGNFTAILGRIDKVPDLILEANIKDSFQIVVDNIADTFESLARKQVKTNKNSKWIGNSEAIVVANLETSLYDNWKHFQHYLFDGKIINYLKRKESNDVCETGISHLQWLERSLNQYMTVANQYMLSQHIIYNIREHTDKQNKDTDRDEFNLKFQKELRQDVEKFKTAMQEVSSDYHLCDPDQNTNKADFIPNMKSEYKQGSTDCESIQNSGYQCFSNNNQNCECSKNTITVSLAMEKADPGYVIVGVQMKISGQLLIVLATQAKLLPNGQIDASTIRPVIKRESDKNQYGEFVIKKSIMQFGNVVIPPNRYMTAVGFKKYSADIFYLSAESTKYDSIKKQLVPSSTKMEQYITTQSGKGTTLSRAVKKSEKGYEFTDNIQPLIDTRVVQSSFPSPLSGIGLFLRGQSEKDGYLAIKINTYNNIPLIPEIPSLSEYPIQQALKSLSDSTSLHDLKKKYETL